MFPRTFTRSSFLVAYLAVAAAASIGCGAHLDVVAQPAVVHPEPHHPHHDSTTVIVRPR